MAFTFVPFRGTAARDIEIRDGVMHPTSAEARSQMRQRIGAEAIDLTGFDAIAVVGFGLKQQHAQALWKDARWPGLPSLEAVEDLAGMRPTLISRRAAEAGLSGYLRQITGFDVAARIAKALPCPVFVIGQPRLHAGGAAPSDGPVLRAGPCHQVGRCRPDLGALRECQRRGRRGLGGEPLAAAPRDGRRSYPDPPALYGRDAACDGEGRRAGRDRGFQASQRRLWGADAGSTGRDARHDAEHYADYDANHDTVPEPPR